MYNLKKSLLKKYLPYSWHKPKTYLEGTKPKDSPCETAINLQGFWVAPMVKVDHIYKYII